MATFEEPPWLKINEFIPTAVLSNPVVFEPIEAYPIATLSSPVVNASSDAAPSEVFLIADTTVKPKFPAFAPTNVLSVPKLWINLDPALYITPSAAVASVVGILIL
ncbi:MAG: hypothetical protein KBF62_02800, partial [Candidatus Pacebacteria bacterium]|nr:hypothetical protein [Candidatus Paceibacterota bacterium]